MRATLAYAYRHDPPLLAKYTGSTQLLPNGDVLVGWGSEPYFTEFAPDGAVRLDARLPPGGQTYRALRFPWSGSPVVPPTLAGARGAGGPRLFASWNGATEVSSWHLLTGETHAALASDSTFPRSGFETELPVSRASRYAAVVAPDRRGEPLGRSATIAV
jgi:hypothetical protein